MSEYKSEFLRELSWRGFIKQATHPAELDSYCMSGVPVAYVGYDATATSLHVGNMVTIMMLRHFQKCGGKPIVLIGGGTTKVGDPTDKDKSRPILTDAQIASNIEGIKSAYAKYLKFGDGPTDAVMVNNDDWLGKLGYIDLLREIGTHFTINTMIKQETVARRLESEQPYTFLEFNYLLMQSYDFLELFRSRNCRVQFGGSDQWGNIVGGVDLVHKVVGGSAFGLTCPLITTASGAKMGKTADGAVWLNANRKSPYEFWQFWRNTEDADVGRFLRLFTELPLDKIVQLEALQGSEINDAKIALANAATTLLHGDAEAKEAEAAAKAVFSAGASSDSLPTALVPQAELDAGMLVAAACTAAGLSKSNGEARRLIEQGAIRVNDEAVTDPNAKVSSADLKDGAIKISAGKKRHALIKAG